ncbi:uncharacterized protein LOC122528276 [Frieseomelitta varia]|uniref:uncharacterized protein LOC122528276 n=1 Tax=Frieseomelitta varia TaxID=561572 RepID=UPI001CB68172|nr:uncharacterized protein LOC122528276 [Frieseomelitta varia]
MNNVEGKMKKWIELIQMEKLTGVTEDVQATVFGRNKEFNKHIFKLLLYLSHTADKCNKQDYAIGKEIYKLTCALCSILTNILDNNKFISSLFHIIRCLLTMQMFDEAYDVCSYLKAETLRSDCSNDNASDILAKIAYLWHSAVNNEFLILQQDPLNSKNNLQLKNIVKYELEIIQIVHRSSTKQLLSNISSYLNKIATINGESRESIFNDFSIFIIEYLIQTRILFSIKEKYIICRHMLQITSRIICENINEKCLKSVTKVLNTISNYFKEILVEDEECYQCFLLFESMCLVVVKPIECLTENVVKKIEKLIDNYVSLIKRYEYTGSVKWATFSIVQILEPLFIYWETCIKTEKKVYIKNDLLLETMKLVGYLSICFIKQISNKCTSCQSENCMVKKDIYNAVAIKTRCINLISKFSKNDLSKDVCVVAKIFLEQNIALIYEMKEYKCKWWIHLWSTSSALIYNLGIISDCFYEESVSLFSLLFTSIVQFDGIESKSKHINLENPIGFTLHKISTLHYNHNMYREAMTATALNALLNCNDPNSKAFRMWASIKHKSVSSKEITEMTMLACLKKDKSKIEELGLSIDLSKYDLIEICLKEAKGLQEAKVNLSVAIQKVLSELEALKVNPIQYARMVQMLVYHSLNFDYDEDILACIKQAVSNLKQIKMDCNILCLQANLEFYIFVTQLRSVSKKIEMEIENMKFALYAPKVNEIGENESRDVVPAYSMINIKEDSRHMMYLQEALKKWEKCLRQNLKEIAKGYEPLTTLHTLIIAGEYAHLYRYEKCEINIWKFAHALAYELQDNSTIIYVIGRCISLRYINFEWITIAKKLAIKLKDSNDEDTIYAIAVFWISLSDFYFECNMYDEARKLVDESRKLPGISFFKNIAVYLYSLDRILYNCYLYKENIKHEEYTRYIVEILYTLVNLNEELSARKWKPQDKYLFGFDILLSATVNLSLRMNSLLSFQEISAHLVRRLKSAQILGATIRVAEILKSLCYIDLSRVQLNDCEVKLQGLEHILSIETFKVSTNSNLTKMNSGNILQTPTRVIDPIRDLPEYNTSPVLQNKVFSLPEFMRHEDCNCYFCQNISYHYLVFTSTHIRAQLYAFQKNIAASLQHFHGAFKIKENLIKMKEYIPLCMPIKYLPWQERFYIIDYVLLLINFSYFLRSFFNTKQEKIRNIISLAIRICDTNKLKGHPIYMTVNELMLDHSFQSTFSSSDYSKFTVPDPFDIDISKYMQKSNTESNICITPTINNTRSKKPVTLQRNRTPPLLKLTKVSINFSDDEDTSSPPSRYGRTRSHSKLIKRKILNEEYSETVSHTEQETNQSKSSFSLQELIDTKEHNPNISIKDIIKKVELLAPDISEHLYKVDNIDEPATTENVQKLIDLMKDLKVNAISQKNPRKTRHSKKANTDDCSKINEVIALFKDFVINDPMNKETVTSEESISFVKTNTLSYKKQNRNNEEKTDNLEQNNLDKLEKTYKSENTKLKITRKRTEHSVLNKESYNIRTRKSKEKL